MSNIFETKEAYLEFRAKWRKLYADGFHKRQPVAQTGMEYVNGKWEYPVLGYHQISPLNVAYHLAFNAILGREDRGFNRASKVKLGSKYGPYNTKHVVDDEIFTNLGIMDASQRNLISDRISTFLKNLP